MVTMEVWVMVSKMEGTENIWGGVDVDGDNGGVNDNVEDGGGIKMIVVVAVVVVDGDESFTVNEKWKLIWKLLLRL